LFVVLYAVEIQAWLPNFIVPRNHVTPKNFITPFSRCDLRTGAAFSGRILVRMSENKPVTNALDMALWKAAYDGDVELVKKYLEEGANIHSQQPDDGIEITDSFSERAVHPGFSALHLAAMMDHDDVIKVLVEAGADVNARTEGLTTPLHVAAVYKRLKSVQALAKLGADLHAKNEFGKTALLMAKLAVGGNQDTVALLEFMTGNPHETWTDTAITGC